MSSSFGDIKTNVGTRVGDTSTSFATTIGVYVNQRYKDVLRRTNWGAIKDDYTVSIASGTSDYTLPSNFGKELYAFNQNSGKDIPYVSLEKLEQEYATTLNSTGTVDYYSIFNTTDSTAASAARVKKLRTWKIPSADFTLELPYTLYPIDLSADSDELVEEIERAVELGATADAWQTKRQFAKAQYFETMYEKEILNLMWNKDNQPNQIHMMNVQMMSRDEGID